MTPVTFAAVDGGGSRSECAVFDLTGRVSGYSSGGALNPNDIGEEESLRRLSVLLLRAGAGKADHLFCGISGAVGHEDVLRDGISRAFPGVAVRVASDIENVFAFLPSKDGAALICGTGSVCFARKDGVTRRIGGWGWLLDGMCGGGYAVGRAGLEAALRDGDGRGPATSLSGAAEEYLGESAPAAVTRILSGGKPLIAGFAPFVFREAEKGDAVALGVTEAAACGVAEYLSVASGILGEGFSCVCSGGLFSENVFREAFLSAVCRMRITAGIDFLSGPQLLGAARCALSLGGVKPDGGFDRFFLSGVENGKK